MLARVEPGAQGFGLRRDQHLSTTAQSRMTLDFLAYHGSGNEKVNPKHWQFDSVLKM